MLCGHGFGDCDDQSVREAGIVGIEATKRDAAEKALFGERVDDRARFNGQQEGEFVEEAAVQHRHARHLRQFGREVIWSTASLRSEEHTSELQSLMRISYAVFCLKKKMKETSSNNQYSNSKTQH